MKQHVTAPQLARTGIIGFRGDTEGAIDAWLIDARRPRKPAASTAGKRTKGRTRRRHLHRLEYTLKRHRSFLSSRWSPSCRPPEQSISHPVWWCWRLPERLLSLTKQVPVGLIVVCRARLPDSAAWPSRRRLWNNTSTKERSQRLARTDLLTLLSWVHGGVQVRGGCGIAPQPGGSVRHRVERKEI